MFLNSWSISLVVCGLIVLFMMGFAYRSAVRVLLYWNPDSDDNRQIRLENEIWLTSTLVEYGLGVQIISLIVFVLAADQFSHSIVGAMCATGSLLADDFGMPALMVKMAGVFLYGFWIVLHQLDIHSETYPLVRIKYVYLLLLLPLLVADISLEMLYIAGLKPDIITSCCAVVFGETAGGGTNLFSGFSHTMTLVLFYGTGVVLLIMGLLLLRRLRLWLILIYGCGWLWFFVLSLMAVTGVFSSYIYAMPYHKCPFCILKPQYYYIGFVMYTALFLAVFSGMSTLLVEPWRSKEGLAGIVPRYQKSAIRVSLFFMVLFSAITSYHFIRYTIIGGEG